MIPFQMLFLCGVCSCFFHVPLLSCATFAGHTRKYDVCFTPNFSAMRTLVYPLPSMMVELTEEGVRPKVLRPMSNITEMIHSGEQNSKHWLRTTPAKAVFALYSKVIRDYENAGCVKDLPTRVVGVRTIHYRKHRFPEDCPMYVEPPYNTGFRSACSWDVPPPCSSQAHSKQEDESRDKPITLVWNHNFLSLIHI